MEDFKKIKKFADEIFSRYRIYRFKCDNIANKYVCSEKDKIYEIHNFCETIENILSKMKREYATLLRKFNIDLVDRYELGYAGSTFYYKYRAAVNNFLEYFNASN
ncbi:MAG: hypothetical protein LBD05_02045 [Mycoplasmataceae bacterium]|jgi:hypothetical protein|nr:hypothetical protein [Mycoplasmataceae bacterium]